MQTARRRYVLSLPALLGVALVLIYILGVLNAAGSFTKADIPQSAIRLLSVEQLLVRGISILAQPSVIGIVVAGAVGIGLIEFSFRKSPLPLSPARRAAVIRSGIRLGWLYLLFLAVVPIFKPWEVGVSLSPLAAVALFMIAVSKQGRVPHSVPRQLVMIFAAAALAMLLLSAYLLPLPQPTAHFSGCGSLRCTDGTLVTHVDGVWYVWQEPAEEVAAIPETSIKQATLTYPPAKMGNSLLQTVLGAL